MNRCIITLALVGAMMISTVGCSSSSSSDGHTAPTVDRNATTVAADITNAPTDLTEPVTTTTTAVPDAEPIDLVGTWNASLDYADAFNQLGMTLEELVINIRCTFREDGIYMFSAEDDDLHEPFLKHADAFIAIAAAGIDETMTIEEYLASEDLTREEFITLFIEQTALADNISGIYGTYSFEGDTLIMDEAEAPYTVNGNAVTIDSNGMTVILTPYNESEDADPVIDPADTTATETGILGTWSGGYSMNGMLGFDTAHTLMQHVSYTFNADGSFTGTAGIPVDEIETFIDAVLAEQGKTCEEMFSADRETVIEEVTVVTTGVIDNGTYTVNGTQVTMSANDFVFMATLSGDVLTVDDGGIAYDCTKTAP